MKKYTLLVSLFLMTLNAQAIAESVKIVTLNWGDYVGEQLRDNGPHARIVREAFKKVGLTVEFKFYPWKRAYRLALKGKAFLISASDTDERRQIFFFSEPYDNAASYLIGLKKKKFKYDGNIQSFKEYRISILRGHYLVKMLKSAGANNIIEVDKDETNLKVLFRGRVDFIAMSKIPAIAIIKNVPNISGTLDQVVFFEPPLRKNPIHLTGHKEMPKSNEIVLEFNKGLKQIKEDGTYDSIMEISVFK